MALPPGSVFKTLTAIALVESGTVDPYETFFCQGYLETSRPTPLHDLSTPWSRARATNLFDALGRSCNVYFFHFATKMESSHWSIGRTDLVSVSGPASTSQTKRRGLFPRRKISALAEVRVMPLEEERHPALAIGQHRLTVTPLQVARMMAAVANGGQLVTPHLVRGMGLTESGGDGRRRSEIRGEERDGTDDSEAGWCTCHPHGP